MDWIEWVGHTGSALSSLTFVPQVYQTWKSRSVKDLNIYMLLIVFSSTLIWIVYGVSRGLLPVIICNSIISLLSLLLIGFKIKFSNEQNQK
jgi:MtN3 and saliva related transmembrane protein